MYPEPARAAPAVLAAILVCVVVGACSSSVTLDAGPSDDGSADTGSADASTLADAAGYEVPDCGVGFSIYSYASDGAASTTGCVTARTMWILRDESVGPGRPRSQLRFVYASEAASDLSLRGLPPHLCGGNIQLFNIQPETGAAGEVIGDSNLDGEASAAVLTIGYTSTGSTELCNGSAPAIAGAWRIVQGGVPGDVLEIHATNVEIEPFDGHTLRFPWMAWRAVLRDPTMYP